jgi:hypothetical protein
MNDRESDLGRRITRRLRPSLDNIDPQVLARLQSARELALTRLQPQPVWSAVTESGADSSSGVLRRYSPRYIVAIAALLSVIVGTVYFTQKQPNDDVADIDAKLLSGDLPIDAYLDKGLDSWLKRTSR